MLMVRLGHAGSTMDTPTYLRDVIPRWQVVQGMLTCSFDRSTGFVIAACAVLRTLLSAEPESWIDANYLVVPENSLVGV